MFASAIKDSQENTAAKWVRTLKGRLSSSSGNISSSISISSNSSSSNISSSSNNSSGSIMFISSSEILLQLRKLRT